MPVIAFNCLKIGSDTCTLLAKAWKKEESFPEAAVAGAEGSFFSPAECFSCTAVATLSPNSVQGVAAFFTCFALGWAPAPVVSGTRLDFMSSKVFVSGWQKGDKPGQSDLFHVIYISMKLAILILLILFLVCTEVRTQHTGFMSWTGIKIIFLQVLVFIRY